LHQWTVKAYLYQLSAVFVPCLIYGELEKMEQIENRMVVDWVWDEIEYGIPNRHRLKRERQAYEEAEREDRENEYIV